jgi:hypothetical protein
VSRASTSSEAGLASDGFWGERHPVNGASGMLHIEAPCCGGFVRPPSTTIPHRVPRDRFRTSYHPPPCVVKGTERPMPTPDHPRRFRVLACMLARGALGEDSSTREAARSRPTKEHAIFLFAEDVMRATKCLAGVADAETGSFSFPQGFFGSLNLDVHFHLPTVDAVFERHGQGRRACTRRRVARRPTSPTSCDVSTIAPWCGCAGTAPSPRAARKTAVTSLPPRRP